MAGRVDGKVALITGGARGMGRAHAQRLAVEGADVVILDRLAGYDWLGFGLSGVDDLAATAELVTASGGRVLARQADVTDRAQVQAVVDEALDTFGHLDIVVANAGIATPGAPFWEIPPQQWTDTFAVNVTGVWNTCSAVAPHLVTAGGGSIVVISSSAGLMGIPRVAAYTASKWAAVGLAKAMANELAPSNVRVNCVCPGMVGTDMVLNPSAYRLFRPDLPDPRPEDVRETFVTLNPMGQPWLEPDDIANLVLFLASDEARYLTGAVIPVDMGNSNAVPFS